MRGRQVGSPLGSALRVICCNSHVFADTPASAAASTIVFKVSGSRSVIRA